MTNLQDIVAGRAALPLTLLTGFLGSGKTTLLNHLLARPELGDSAVLINEYGEVGLDHLFVRDVTENVVLLQSGCLCCTVRGDLVEALRELFIQLIKGEVPPFARVLVETTGLADPAPVVHTMLTDPLLSSRFALTGIVTTVDACHGLEQLERQEESARQAALADHLVITKLDVAPPGARERLTERLKQVNSGARILTAEEARSDPEPMLRSPMDSAAATARWLSHADQPAVDHGITSFTLTSTMPLDWTRFSAWLQELLTAHGAEILRMKGVLDVAGEPAPVVVHGVQHIFHPARRLPSWDGLDRGSRLVVITRGIPRDAVEPGFLRQVALPAPGTGTASF